MTLDPELLKLLACPACKKPLKSVAQGLDCPACRKRYPVRDGIPVLLIEEAAALD
ncbi:MAG: Trm112 family protein [Elusimicrobiota bacterium]